jgi:hypothetical protein
MTELIGDAIRPMAAEGLIHQGNGQLLAGGIRHHAGQPCGLLLLCSGLLLPGGAQQPRSQCYHLLWEVVA